MLEELKLEIVKERISVYLMILKITPNLKGYTYLRECALRIFQDASKKFDIHHNLYVELSEEFNEKITLIERSLRHAIDVSLRRGGIDDFERLMKYEFCKSKPTPRELLCIIVELASMECSQILSNINRTVNRWQENFINWQKAVNFF